MCLQVHLTHKHIKAIFKVIKILAPTKLFNGYPLTLIVFLVQLYHLSHSKKATTIDVISIALQYYLAPFKMVSIKWVWFWILSIS